MNVIAAAPLMTAEELRALPDDGVERWLIRGQLREASPESSMTYRNRRHGQIEAHLAQLLGNWLDQQSQPRGEILSGEAGCRLRRNPDTVVGIDVVYIAADLAAQEAEDTTLIAGVPLLVAEILSPSDKQEEINEKVDEYLGTGVALVWIIDPHYRTVRVHRAGAEPELFNISQDLSGEPHLPGFRTAVARTFGR